MRPYVDNRAGSFGYIEACSTPLAKIRQDYPSDTMIFADVHTAETYGVPNVAINELAGNAKGHDADAVIVTENDLNKKITPADVVKSMREEMGDFPIIVGAGVKPNNVLGLHGVLRCRYRRPRLQDPATALTRSSSRSSWRSSTASSTDFAPSFTFSDR